MIDKLEESNKTQDLNTYESIAILVFLVCLGGVYLIPNAFPQGTLFVVAGVLFIIFNIITYFKINKYNVFNISIGVALLAYGLNKIFLLEIRFIPLVIIVFAMLHLLMHFKALRRK